MIKEKRFIKLFSDLVSIDSVSFQERECADYIIARLKELGLEVYEDQAGERYNGTAGNVYGFLPSNRKTSENKRATLFSAHMDTVSPGKGKKVRYLPDGKIVSEGNTVLGADDISGIVSILEALYRIQEQNLTHDDIEVLFTIGEEVYAKGSKEFNYERIKAKNAYVFDLSGKVGTASLQEPTLISYKVNIKGKASHAGFAPEEGVNAIAVAAEVIHQTKQGRLDEETTHNIGTIHGGTATNIVSEQVTIEGEIRSYNHEKALQYWEEVKQIFQREAEKVGAEVFSEKEINLKAYQIDKEEEIVKNYEMVCLQLEIKSHLVKTFGGSDNNIFLQHGIRGIVLACAMNQVHTTKEYTQIEELERSIEIALHLMIKN